MNGIYIRCNVKYMMHNRKGLGDSSGSGLEDSEHFYLPDTNSLPPPFMPQSLLSMMSHEHLTHEKKRKGSKTKKKKKGKYCLKGNIISFRM